MASSTCLFFSNSSCPSCVFRTSLSQLLHVLLPRQCMISRVLCDTATTYSPYGALASVATNAAASSPPATQALRRWRWFYGVDARQRRVDLRMVDSELFRLEQVVRTLCRCIKSSLSFYKTRAHAPFASFRLLRNQSHFLGSTITSELCDHHYHTIRIGGITCS